MSVDTISNVYTSVTSKSNFGKLHGILKRSNYENLLQMTADNKVLAQNFLGSDDIRKISKEEEFYHLITYMFQSLTNIGYTTYEILDFITTALTSQGMNEEEIKRITNFLSGSFCFVHANYSKTKIWSNKNKRKILRKILFGHSSIDYFNMGLVFGNNSALVIGADPSYKRDIKTLSTFAGATNPNYSQVDNYKRLRGNFTNSSLNKNIANPSKTQTSVSSVLVTDPRIRVGTQNHLELSTFFNGLTTLEMNRSYPYLNATFILPTLSKQTKVKDGVYKFNAKSSTISSFLFSGDNKTKNYNDLGGDSVRAGVRKANMSLFTSPQTMVNFDEPIGHNQNNKNNQRYNTVNDPTQPFMSITGFSINTAPTKGLMSYKTGTLNVILHDRTRMPEIAPFVKPDLLGAFGAEIVIEYGWSNPDQENEKNPMGYFIGNSRVVEKYMIINSSLSIDNNGQVNINLSLAMKGPHEFKNQKISTKVHGRVTEEEFKKQIAYLNYNRFALISSNNKYLEKFNFESAMFADVFNETSRISKEAGDALTSFKTIHALLARFVKGNLSKYVEVSLFENNTKFNIIIKSNANEYKETLANMLSTGKDLKSVNDQIIIEYENKNEFNKEQIFFYITEIYKSTIDVSNYIDYIQRQDKKEGDNERKIIETIVGSAQYIDHFYPTDDRLYPDRNPTNYISFGSVVNTIVQNFVANRGNKFDEIQTVFYNANQYAGKMANRNLANFLISRKLLTNLLEKIFSNNSVITPESLISQIILKCIKRKDNITLGLSDLYENSNDDPSKPLEIKQSLKENNTFEKDMLEKLRNIYKLDDNFPEEHLKFVLPVVHMNFDCLTSNSLESKHKERTILRISIFDKADSPFQSSSEILENIYSGKIDKVIGGLVDLRDDFRHKREEEKNKNFIDRTAIKKFNTKHKSEIQRLLDKKLIKKTNPGYAINKAVFNNNNSKFIGDIKSIYKRIYPSLTYGTQNSIMTSANVSTVNDNKLGTIFITRDERNDQSLINNRINEQMPLLIMPTQATVEIFGCPWVNFGQSIFLDFETGTTLDNKYVVTGITHNLSPGKFSTQLTLTYGDNYGQLRNAKELLNESANFSGTKKRKKPRIRKSKPGDTLEVTIEPGYEKNSNYNRDLSPPMPSNI